MPTIVESQIGWGTNDYASIGAWLTATATDLVSADEQHWAVLDPGVTYFGELTVSGATTDATRFRGIKARSGFETTGLAGTGPRIYENRAFFKIMNLSEDFFHIYGIELDCEDGNTSFINFNFSYQGFSIENCIIHNGNYIILGAGGTVPGTYVSNKFINCAFWDNLGMSGANSNTDFFEFIHCTLLRNQTYSANSFTLNYVKATNSVAMHYGGSGIEKCWGSNIDGGSSNYAASDDSGSSAGLDNLVATDQFVSVGGTWDLHLKVGSALEGAGTTTAYTTDIDGDTRDGSTPDIGFDEYVAAGPTPEAAGNLRVYAYNVADATPATGIADSITCKVSLDYAAPSSITDVNPVEIANGNYIFDLTVGEQTGDVLEYYPTSSASGVQVQAERQIKTERKLSIEGLDSILIEELTADFEVGSSVKKLFDLAHYVTKRKSDLTRSTGAQRYFDTTGTSGVLNATQTDNGTSFTVSNLTKS